MALGSFNFIVLLSFSGVVAGFGQCYVYFIVINSFGF